MGVDWQDEIVGAIEFALAQEKRDTGRRPWRPIGSARRQGERAVYLVDIRGSRSVDVSDVSALCLAGPQGPDVGDFCTPLDVTVAGPELEVRVPEFFDLQPAVLYQRRQPASYLLESLRDGFRTLRRGLVDDLVLGRLTATPLTVPDVPGSVSQRQAYAACFEPGVRLVWGPPGTGKTKVLTGAIDDLAGAGTRVLLVSATNIAVDNAVHGVACSRRRQAGELVRVGPAHLREVAENASISLTGLVEQRLDQLRRARDEIADQLAALRAAGQQLTTLEMRLSGFDQQEYAAAQQRITNEQAVPILAAAAQRTSEEAAQARDGLVAARTAAREAEQRVDTVADSERLLDEIDRLRAAAAEPVTAANNLAVRLAGARDQQAQALDLLRHAEQQPWLRRWQLRGRLRRLRADVDHWQSTEAQLTEHTRQAQQAAQKFVADTAARIQRIRQRVRHTREDIARVRGQAAEATEATRRAQLALTAAHEGADQARECWQQSARAPVATTADHDLVEAADVRGLPALYEQVTRLRGRREVDAARTEALKAEYVKRAEEFDKARRSAEDSVIRQARIVATTLARARISAAVAAGPYDVVLVDEVAAASLPEVLWAVSLASTCAVLFGDFLQLGPVINDKVRRANRPDVRKWWLRNVFELCGITTPHHAQRRPGCVALTTQHRFGPAVMRLVNQVAYDDVLDAGTNVEKREVDDREIVFLDTDGLGDLGMVRPIGKSSGWWPAGALLSRMLVDHHRADGETIGIISPYTAQVEATLEMLRDSEVDSKIVAEVGTAHRFQGREFGVVIFDLVEDETNQRWIARADAKGSDWAREGVRLFTVAATRVQQRLYVIGSATCLQRARSGSPLAHLAAVVGRRIVRADALLTPTEYLAQNTKLGPFGLELAVTCSRHVVVSDIQDERQFYTTFADHLDQARHSIWLWAPWTTNRLDQLLPNLAAARDRGVRVTVFIRDGRDHVQRQQSDRIDALRAAVTQVVMINKMHQKTVVIDNRLVLCGSLNSLSLAQQSASQNREVMLTIQGRHFAERVLEHEQVRRFTAKPPVCGTCGSDQMMTVTRLTDDWHWRCGTPAPKPDRPNSTCGWRLAIPRPDRTTGR